LYRNPRIFPVSFALIDDPFAILWVTDLLSRAESLFAGGFRDWNFGRAEFLTARGEELSDVLDRIVRIEGRGAFAAVTGRHALAAIGGAALVLVFVGVMRIGNRGVVITEAGAGT